MVVLQAKEDADARKQSFGERTFFLIFYWLFEIKAMALLGTFFCVCNDRRMFGWFSRGKPEEPTKKPTSRSTANLESLGIDPSIFEDPVDDGEEEEGTYSNA